ncbi:hypothetical protein M2347_000040 [Chryseobacterium sp. H1D6B]|uniref:hypothetical protein n=1 Tax=Chryseobacterium sp. H1D6B TaxID=2940588 RepID=UPI0015C69CF0|nr:hypothetical protein [Chryseobacterium sp. H1D6B]MDH6250313.1 hypothetical protein [Chryseobacterium sp. H1D6B]
MRKDSFPTDSDDGKLVLKSIKLAEPLVKPEIEEAIIPVEEINTDQTKKKSITKKLIDQLKKIKDELFKRS